ncbi:glutathione S-transferase family protein [Actinomadura rudentiformis]|uniref:Glutathione S-transferase family protein n=1 Tax=Actinomadura rudentiformis TaxID=359158 RepID=A0A6H9YKB1_9ACTN|nr:glutathione S-transferase family protein [Actinomadura rudentiformis]KAB2343317.1 glutathione S-transferase family protein [Actinomadura rudentiformis]
MITQEMAAGRFVRQPNRFTDTITADGSSGYPAESGRYRLFVSYACPWAQRTLIVRALLGLDEVISLGVVDPIRDERGWRFPDRDPVTGAAFLSELYLATDGSYKGRYTVPCIWDTVTGRLVTNDFPAITTTFETQFTDYHPTGAPDLYPVELRPDIDELNELVYATVNNGVYRAGFATEQNAYEEAVDALFATLDRLEERLSTRRYLFGDRVTEADIRLYTTLARFDAVYHGHFKCNLRRLVDYPNLWGYARDLYEQPAFRDTTDFDQIKRHYYVTLTNVNPSGVVPKGPVVDWTEPHGRAALSAS